MARRLESLSELSDQTVRQAIADGMGLTLSEYEHTLRAIGVDYKNPTEPYEGYLQRQYY